jgi:hypothetical protein
MNTFQAHFNSFLFLFIIIIIIFFFLKWGPRKYTRKIEVQFLLGNSPAAVYYWPTFRKLYRFHLHRPMKMEPIERSETSASNTQTPGNYQKETVLHLQHGENPNLKSRKIEFPYSV